MEIELIHSIDNVNWEEMREVYQSVGWNKHTIHIIQKVFQTSNVITIATVNNRIIGFGRAISDEVFNAAIYDIIVHKDFQKLGIAKQIINDLLLRLKHVSCVHLISTTGNVEFYQKLGFKQTKTGMARYLNSTLAEEYLSH